MTVNAERNIILKGHQIVIPTVYQNIVVSLAHIGHQGILKTKSLLRSKVFFFGLDKKVEKEIMHCIPCQAVGNAKPQEPIKSTKIPPKVWQVIHADYLGPLPNGQYIFVVMDQRSRFPEVEFVNSTSANQLVSRLHRIFTTYGFPEKFISDNGPPFKSFNLANYMKKYGIRHIRVMPRWPRANGEVERFMKPLTKIIQTAYIERRDWKEECYNFLLAYRSTPHVTT